MRERGKAVKLESDSHAIMCRERYTPWKSRFDNNEGRRGIGGEGMRPRALSVSVKIWCKERFAGGPTAGRLNSDRISQLVPNGRPMDSCRSGNGQSFSLPQSETH